MERLPRQRFVRVSPLPLGLKDLGALLFPNVSSEEEAAALEGLKFFTTPHVESQGLGPMANQRFCQGCHLNTEDAVRSQGGNQLVTAASPLGRAARSTPTNFNFTGLDPATGGGRAPDNLDAINNTGKSAAFTLFGDFNPSTLVFNPLATVSTGGVQRVRPSLAACLPVALPSLAGDSLLTMGFRRTTGERQGPPYIGRGLMEAVPDGEILALEQAESAPIQSSLPAGDFPACTGDCAAGRHNASKPSAAFVCPADPTVTCGTNFNDVLVGRLGLRAAGPTLTQFMIGGSNGELGFTSPFMPTEPFSALNANRPGCVNSVPSPELPLSTILSLRTLIRLIAPPDFGVALQHVLHSRDPQAPFPSTTKEAKVQRGAELFGIDLTAFADRMIPGRMPAGGDGRDEHAINQADRKLNCVGCHTPVVTTGQLPAEVGASHLNNAWVPLFSDLLIHEGPNIDAERDAATVRLPVSMQRIDSKNHLFTTFDIARGTADDTLPGPGVATGREWRTAPLMGLGTIGPPFLHDGRVYLSRETVFTTPASTVYTDRDSTNAPLVVRTLNTAIQAAVELHDLPAPFDDPKQSTRTGGGCPVPPGNAVGAVVYQNGAADICPPLTSPNRSAARKVIGRWHSLSAEDQQAVIEFLKQL